MNKESFILYTSFYKPIQKTDEQLGRLFRAIFIYQLEGVEEVDADIEMAFAFFVNQFEIDASKYRKRVEKNRENGSKGGIAKANKNNEGAETNSMHTTPTETNATKASDRYQSLPTATDCYQSVATAKNCSLNDNDNENDNDNDNDDYVDIERRQVASAVVGDGFRDMGLVDSYQTEKTKGGHARLPINESAGVRGGPRAAILSTKFVGG